MSHDISDFADKLDWSETCSYGLNEITKVADYLKTQGMTEAQLSKNALDGEYGVLKGKMIAGGEFQLEDVLFTGVRHGTTDIKMLVTFENKPLADWELELMEGLPPIDLKVFRIYWDDPHTKDTLLSFEEFEANWLHKSNLEWKIGKAAKKLDVSPASDSLGAMTDEDIATMFVKTKDQLAKDKGILDLKGTNKALDQEVYDAIGKETGYTQAEVKAKVDAYKASGKKLSSLKKKVVKKAEKVAAPNGVPIAPTKETLQDVANQLASIIEDKPGIAIKVYQDQDIAAAYIKAKDDLAALESNPWTLYTQDDEFTEAIYNRIRDQYGITLDNQAIDKAIANYTGQGNKLSVLKKKLAKSKDDPWTPKADTLKSKAQAFHVTAPKPGEFPTPPPSSSIAGTPVAQLSEFDVMSLPESIRQKIYDDFKKEGAHAYLTSAPENIYEAAVKVAKKWGGPGSFEEADALSVLKVIDERGAIKFGVENTRPFENRVVDFLKTPAGKTYAKAKAEAQYWIDHQPDLPADSTLFQVIDTSQARAMQRTMGDWTPAQKDALTRYTGSYYTDFNQQLRSGRALGSGSGGYVNPQLTKWIRDAMSGMKKVTRNFLVHRGTSFTQFGVSSFEDLVRMVGSDITDEGFVSTSVGGSAAFSNSVLMEIEVPTGARGAYVKGISLHPGENEFILAPGTRFRILKVSKPDAYRTVVRVRVIV